MAGGNVVRVARRPSHSALHSRHFFSTQFRAKLPCLSLGGGVEGIGGGWGEIRKPRRRSRIISCLYPCAHRSQTPG